MRRGLGLDRYKRRPDAPDERKLEPIRPQAEIESENVELQAIHAARRDPEKAAQGKLKAAAARRRGENGVPR